MHDTIHLSHISCVWLSNLYTFVFERSLSPYKAVENMRSYLNDIFLFRMPL